MSTDKLFRAAAENPITTLLLMLVTIVMAVCIYGNIQDMRTATTGYEYCGALCYLFEYICISYFMAIFFIMGCLTYINKRYSKWSIWLIYVLGASVFIKFFIANMIFSYIYHHVESQYMDQLPSLANRVYSGAIYWIAIVFFVVPKFIKDTIKLKKEQELTI